MWGRLDYGLLKNSPVTLYLNEEILREDVAWLEAHEYAVRTLDAGRWNNEGDMHEAFATTLGFPEGYGNNLDALHDSLSCIDIPQQGGTVLVLREYSRFAELHPSAAQSVLDIIASVAHRYLLTGQRLLALVHSTAPDITFEPVGASPVCLNPKEYLSKYLGH